MPPPEDARPESSPEDLPEGRVGERRPLTPGEERAQAQLELLLREFGDEIGRGPENWREVGTQFLYRRNHILVRDEYLDRVRGIVDGTDLVASLVQGVSLLFTPGGSTAALRRIRGAERREQNIEPGRRDQGQLGVGGADYDYLLTITSNGDGAGGTCPASEPHPVHPDTPPYPGPTLDDCAGEGIRVVVIDTGLDPDASTTHTWMDGVTGDSDPAVPAGQAPGRPLDPYAGHGTFVAGAVRSMAPRVEVIVKRIFDRMGATFESNLVRALDLVLERDYPDVISMSAGTWTLNPTGLLGLTVFNETRLRHHKGVVLVVAAGNDDSRRPFWPAAAPWTISVGALDRDWRDRAYFSNYGRWVDVYAPGQDLVNAFPVGTYTYHEPPHPGETHPHQPGTSEVFAGMAEWSGTSFSTPMVAGMIAARMSRTGENGRDAGAALLEIARSTAIFGLGAALLPR